MSYGKAFGNQVLNEINKVRSNPRYLGQKLQSYLNKFKGNVLYLPGIPNGLLYTEGPKIFEEAIDYLCSVPSLPPLKADNDLAFAAQTAAEQMGKVKDFGTVPGVTKNTIPSRFFSLKGKFGQSSDFGSLSPDLVVMNLVIDDGDSRRKNRGMMFSDLYEFVGCGSAKNSTYGAVTVIMYSTFYEKVPQQEDIKVKGGVNYGDGLKRFRVDKIYTLKYNPQETKLLHDEDEIFLSGIPYRYINNVSPNLDLITDTAKDPDTRKNFEKMYGVKVNNY